MGKIIIETQYFPTIAFFSFLKNVESFYVEANEHYLKRSYRNRCHIQSSQGILSLSVPLKKGKNEQLDIKEVQLDYSSSWNINHLKSISSCYGKAPFFPFYYPDIENILTKKWSHLFELNKTICEYLIRSLQIEHPILYTNKYSKIYSPNQDRRNTFVPIEKTENETSDFLFHEYEQVFSQQNPFQVNLSVLDLLFCLGPESNLYLKRVFKGN